MNTNTLCQRTRDQLLAVGVALQSDWQDTPQLGREVRFAFLLGVLAGTILGGCIMGVMALEVLVNAPG